MNKEQNTRLFYGAEDKLPASLYVVAVLQHLLAVFLAIITPALLLGEHLGLSYEEKRYLVSMSLFASGLATLLQVNRFGFVGSGLLCIQGTSFAFLPLMLTMANGPSDLPTLFGSTMLGSLVVLVLAPFISYMKKCFTPLVMGTVIILIGVALMKVGIFSFAGGAVAQREGHFAHWSYLLSAMTVFFGIVFLNRSKFAFIRMSSIIIAILAGFLVYHYFGLQEAVKASSISVLQDSWTWQIPHPFLWGIKFSPTAVFSFAVIYLISAIEAVGVVSTACMLSDLPIEGKDYLKRVRGALLVDGLGSFLAGVFNTFPLTMFSQNNGVIQLTGIASRFVGLGVAILLMLFGCLPFFAYLFLKIPACVIGGATLLTFSSIAVSGIRILAKEVEFNNRNILIMTVSLALGVGLSYEPELFPDVSGVIVGSLAALILNLLLKDHQAVV